MELYSIDNSEPVSKKNNRFIPRESQSKQQHDAKELDVVKIMKKKSQRKLMAKGMFVYDPVVKVVKQQSNSEHASQKARKAERQCAEQLNHKNAENVAESKSSDNLINSDQLANIKGISSQSLSNFNQEGANNILETSS